MKHDGEAGQTAGDFLQDVEAQRRRDKDAVGIAGALLRLELVSAVAGADGDGQRIDAGLGDEFLDLLRAGVGADGMADLSSMPASVPSSPSTTTPWAWAYSTTLRVSSILSSKL